MSAAIMRQALPLLRQLTSLTLWGPCMAAVLGPGPLASLHCLQELSLRGNGGRSQAASLAAGPWQTSLRRLASPGWLANSSLPACTMATQLTALSLLDVDGCGSLQRVLQNAMVLPNLRLLQLESRQPSPDLVTAVLQVQRASRALKCRYHESAPCE
jgi:hypothetical protein